MSTRTTAESAHTAPNSAPTTDGAGPSDGNVPRWFLCIVAVGTSVTATISIAGVTLAIAGRYRTLWALVLGVPVGLALAAAVLRRSGPRPTTSPAGHRAAAAMVALAVCLGAAIAWTPGQHVVLNRDPAMYQTTARWLSQEGTLWATAVEGGLDAVPRDRLDFETLAVYDLGNNRVEFQFAHGATVLLATALDVGGTRLMLRLPALALALGLLSLYAVALRITRRPWLSLLAPAILGVSLPWWFVGRDTYSEPFTVLLLWGAVALLVEVARRPRPAAGAAVGVILGALIGVRADAGLYVAALLFLGGVGAFSDAGEEGPARRQTYAALVAAFAVAVVPGVVDLVAFTGRYVTNLGKEVRILRAMVVLGCLGGVAVGWACRTLAARRSGLAAAARRTMDRAAAPAAAVVGALFLALWLVRPSLQTSIDRSFRYGIVEAIQRRDGLPVNGFQRYAEDTVRWMQWYYGPITVLLGIVGAAWGIAQVLRRRADEALAFVALTTVGAAAIYFWNPNITPDHPWASRRFAPMVYPGFVLLAVLVVALLCGTAVRPRGRRLVAVTVVGSLMVAWPALVTWPVRQLAPQRSYLPPLRAACDEVGSDATVVVVGGFARFVLPQVLRAWCGVPVASTSEKFTADDFRSLRRATDRLGRRLVVVSTDAASFEDVPDDLLGRVRAFPTKGDVRSVLPTVDRVPSEYAPADPDVPKVPGEPFVFYVAGVGDR